MIVGPRPEGPGRGQKLKPQARFSEIGEIDNASALVVLLTEHSGLSAYVHQEISYAAAEDMCVGRVETPFCGPCMETRRERCRWGCLQLFEDRVAPSLASRDTVSNETGRH